ncbi:hypothetical protein MNBD_NITROSPINAE03-2038 [hydrothermal vent metagenome]|uniref:Uncharacterized protein n=1 Tax=hydrothermal vent metagenome TaxID=652676 RepID=A0A3B1CJD9_9ZZZZ
MKVWFNNSEPTKVISLGKSVGDVDETFFEHDGELAHGVVHDYYTISNRDTLVPRSKAAVDQARAAKVAAKTQMAADREARLYKAKNHAANGIPSTQPGLQAAVNLLYKMLDDKGMLDG